MNDNMILKLIKPLISDEKINDFISYITEKATAESAAIMAARDPEETLIGIAFFAENQIKIGYAVINSDFKIIEVIKAEPITEAATRLLKAL